MYNPKHCHSVIRRCLDLESRISRVRIIVAGKHAFGWSVTVIKEGYNKSLTFPNRVAALKQYQELQTQFRLVGDCSLKV